MDVTFYSFLFWWTITLRICKIYWSFREIRIIIINLMPKFVSILKIWWKHEQFTKIMTLLQSRTRQDTVNQVKQITYQTTQQSVQHWALSLRLFFTYKVTLAVTSRRKKHKILSRGKEGGERMGDNTRRICSRAKEGRLHSSSNGGRVSIAVSPTSCVCDNCRAPWCTCTL